jgi:hypothetical protein
LLAYVFWHWKRADVDIGAYEDRLVHFHRALQSPPPDGLSSSGSFALRGAPWAHDGGEAWEDWYLLRTSADLDSLNDAAVSAARQAPHDAAAAAAAGGTAGLYRLRLGVPVMRPTLAAWFSKPAGWSYPALLERLAASVVDGKAALWGRQMTLGPSREFCLHSATPVDLPEELDALDIPLRAVFPAAG